MGHLTLIIGCMFAQKTTEILRRIRRFQSIGKRVLVLKYAGDLRYAAESIASHDGEMCQARVVKELAELNTEIYNKEYDVVVIDEGQFFKDLLQKVKEWTDSIDGLHVIVAGLDGDSERRPFGDLLNLICLAEEVKRLSAYCKMCRDGTEAHFTKWIGDTNKDGQVCVGGADNYMPVCRKHWLSPNA